MALKLYRRHRKECEGGHPEDSKSGEFEEGRRGWKRCACIIHLTGTLDGKFKRQQTGKSSWEEAKAVAAQWEACGRWDSRPSEPSHPKPDAGAERETPRRTKIIEATEAFLSRCEMRGIALPTLRKYRTFVKQLRTFCDAKGYVLLDQLGVADMDLFYASWNDGKRARAKKLDRLKSFVKFCLKRKWLTEDIAEDLKAPEGSSLPANKEPFTDEELDRIYAVCDRLGPPTPRGPGHRPWSGEDVKTFILLSVYTGLRISDVAMFDTSKRLSGNNVFLRQHKTGKPLFTWIPDWLVDRLREREKQHGPFIFGSGKTEQMITVAKRWRGYLDKVFALSGPWDIRPTPHRLRHTFVRLLLEKDVPEEHVATLIGDTVEVLRRHYAKWMSGRQKLLSDILREKLGDRPRPKLVEIPKLG